MLGMSSEELVETFEFPIMSLADELLAESGARIGSTELTRCGMKEMLRAARHAGGIDGLDFWTFAHPRVEAAMLAAIRDAPQLPRAPEPPRTPDLQDHGDARWDGARLVATLRSALRRLRVEQS
jgi:hypothetical protein